MLLDDGDGTYRDDGVRGNAMQAQAMPAISLDTRSIRPVDFISL